MHGRYIEGSVEVKVKLIIFAKTMLTRRSTVYPPTVAFAFTRIMLILEESSIPRSKPNGVSVCGEVCHVLPFASQQIKNATLRRKIPCSFFN